MSTFVHNYVPHAFCILIYLSVYFLSLRATNFVSR